MSGVADADSLVGRPGTKSAAARERGPCSLRSLSVFLVDQAVRILVSFLQRHKQCFHKRAHLIRPAARAATHGACFDDAR
eukprot:scaffold88_cov387-Prasinococcus_capsulatus_cf.AAC.11